MALLGFCSVTLDKSPTLSEPLSWGGDDVYRARHVMTDSTSRVHCHLWGRPGERRDFQVGEPQGSSLASGGGGLAPAKQRILWGPRFRRPGSGWGDTAF